MFPNFETFNTVMDACTENFECLVIDYKAQSNKLQDQVYWYKANIKDFKMCNQELWDLCAIEEQRKENGSLEDNEEPFDPNFFVKNRSKVKLNVHKKNYYNIYIMDFVSSDFGHGGGGLGNQLFRLAISLEYAKKYNKIPIFKKVK